MVAEGANQNLRSRMSLQSKPLKNSLLVNFESCKSKSLLSTSISSHPSKPSGTKNALLQKLNQRSNMSNAGSPIKSSLKNNLLEKTSVLKNSILNSQTKNTLLQSRRPISTNNSQLDLSCRTYTLSKISLQNDLLQTSSARPSILRNRQLDTRIGVSKSLGHLQIKNRLLAPSFNNLNGKSQGLSPEEPGQVLDTMESKFVSVDVAPLTDDDLVIKAKLHKYLDFPISSEIKEGIIVDSPSLIAKSGLIDCVCTALINNPFWFSAADKTRTRLYDLCREIAQTDPEFILKIALYTRMELNIRVVCNFLLALASLLPSCRSYLKKYFNKSIGLPSDWMQVAEFYKSLSDPDDLEKNVKLPSALRKVMLNKFPDFDEYRLAKYNKDKAKTSKKKKAKEGAEKKRDVEKEAEDEKKENAKPKVNVPSYTLKFLIRKLHIQKPADHVMCILGKKYPDSVESFYKAGLEGTWDSVLAGKRMKLEVPETWETQVSAKGNKSKTWEDLLDHKKLPFMAMLRNIRNMIRAGMLDNYHTKVLRTLTNERAVMKSRQFPFRFFSAYEVLNELEEDIEKQVKYKQHGYKAFLNRNQKQLLSSMKRVFGDERPKSKEEKEIDFMKKQLHKKFGLPLSFDKELLARYKKALNESVKLATANNIPPITGRTVVFCDVGRECMETKCSTSKGMGSVRSLAEVGVLLGLMCAHSCESCTFLICNHQKFRVIEVEKGGILENLTRIMTIARIMNGPSDKKAFLPHSYMDEALINRNRFDNLLVVSNAMNSRDEEKLKTFLERYKDSVNRDIKCYEVDLSGKRLSVTEDTSCQNITKFSGYSDQILKFMALGGGKEQLNCVSNIDRKYNLVDVNVEVREVNKKLPSTISGNVPKPIPWKTVRVFISSTIKDMVSERDALVNYVFPLLRKQAQNKRLHIIETDLRWGITSSDKNYDRSVSICLQEVRKCDIFIAILGERYGWIPQDYGYSESGTEWLDNYPKGRSITELEINQAAFAPSGQKDCFFYFRQSSELKRGMPKQLKDIFFESSGRKQSKLKDLKQRIKESSYPVYEDYPSKWGGFVNSSPTVNCLEDFIKEVKKDLENAVCKFENDVSLTQEQDLHDSYMQLAPGQKFVARTSLFTSFLNKITSEKKKGGKNLVGLVGKPGSGKSALLSAVHKHLSSNMDEGLAFIHFTSSTALDSKSVANVLHRFCMQIKQTFGLHKFHISDDYENLVEMFPKLMEQLNREMNLIPALYLLIDDIDSLDSDIESIIKVVGKFVTIVVTCLESGSMHKALKHMPSVTFQSMIDLSISDKREVVRSILGRHSKKLDESHFNNQMQVIMSKNQSVNPLYLSTVCEMIRVQETFESLTGTLTSLPHNLSGVLEWQLQAVEMRFSEYPNIVGAVLGLIHCSMKWKISEEELYDAVCLRYKKSDSNNTVADPVESNDVPGVLKRTVPRAVLFQILNSVKSFLVTTDTADGIMFSLGHDVHMKLVEEKYLTNQDFAKSCHSTLVDLYTYRLRQHSSISNNDSSIIARCLSRLPLHLTLSKQNNILRILLTNFNYIYLKCSLGLGMELQEDFSYLQSRRETKFIAARSLGNQGSVPWQEMYKFVLSCIHIISNYPEMIYQFALNQPEDSYPYKVCSGMVSTVNSRDCMLVCLEHDNRSAIPDLCTRTFRVAAVRDARTSIATSPGSSLMAWGTKLGRVGILERQTGKDIHDWHGHGDKVLSLCFINKSTLLSGCADGTVSVWNVVGGYRVRIFKAHEGSVNGLVVRPLRQGTSARIFATASHDRTVGFWNVSDGKLVHRLKTDNVSANCIDFHPFDPLIVVGLWDCSLRIWNVQTSKRLAVIRGHLEAVSSVQYSLCGTYIASCSVFESVIRLWAAGAGIPLGNFGEAFLTSSEALTFSSDGNYLIGGGEGTNQNSSQLVIWKSHLGSKQLSYQASQPEECGDALCCSFNSSKTLLGVGFHGGNLAIYDPKLSRPRFISRIHESRITCIAWTKDSTDNFDLSSLFENSYNEEYLITGSTDHTLKAINSSTFSVAATFIGHSAPVLAVECTDNWMASGSEDFDILLWYFGDIKMTGSVSIKHSQALHSHEGPVSCLAFRHDGSMLVSAGRDGKIVYWDTDDSSQIYQNNISQITTGSKKEVKSVAVIDQAHMDWITCCSWNDSSDHIVTGSNDTNLKVWACPRLPLDSSTDYKTPLYVLKGHESGVTSVNYRFGCISSTGGEDNTIRIWSHKGVEITSLKTESRTNCCDVTLQSENNEDDVESVSTPDFEDEEDIKPHFDWADQVELEEWDEEHERRKPGSKRKKKAAAAEMRNFEVACASSHASVSLWKPLIGNKVNVMNGRSRSINQIRISSADEIASCSSDGTIKLWKIDHASEIERHNGEVTSILVMKDCTVTSCDAGFLYLWCKTSGSLQYKVQAHKKRITAMCSLDENVFCTISYDGDATLWKVEGYEDKELMQKQTEALKTKKNEKDESEIELKDFRKLCFISMGTPLTCIGLDASSEINSIWISDIEGRCKKCVVSHDFEKMYETGDIEKAKRGARLQVYRGINGKCAFFDDDINMVDSPLIVHQEFSYSCALISGISEDSNQYVVAVGSNLGFFHIPETNIRIKMHNERITALLDSENFLVTASFDCTIKVWSKPSLKQIGQFFTSSPVSTACYETSESCLLFGDSSGILNKLKLNFVMHSDSLQEAQI